MRRQNGNNQSLLLEIINIKIKFVYSSTICLYLRVFVFVARCSRGFGYRWQVAACWPCWYCCRCFRWSFFCLLCCNHIFNQFDIILLIVIIMLFVVVIAPTTSLSACFVLSYRFCVVVVAWSVPSRSAELA